MPIMTIIKQNIFLFSSWNFRLLSALFLFPLRSLCGGKSICLQFSPFRSFSSIEIEKEIRVSLFPTQNSRRFPAFIYCLACTSFMLKLMSLKPELSWVSHLQNGLLLSMIIPNNIKFESTFLCAILHIPLFPSVFLHGCFCNRCPPVSVSRLAFPHLSCLGCF